MSEISNQVGNRVKWARFVLASFRVHGPEVEQTLTGIYGGAPFGAVFAALAGRLEAITDEMRAAEMALSVELADDAPARAARDEAIEGLRTTLFQARALLDGAFGDGTGVAYGLGATPPRQADELAAVARNAANLMKESPRQASAFGNTIETVSMAGAITTALGSLESALEKVDGEVREAHTARVARDAVIDEWSRVYRGTAGALSAFYGLAGRDDLAERVRPTVRRAAGFEEPPVDGAVDGAEETDVEPVVVEDPVG